MTARSTSPEAGRDQRGFGRDPQPLPGQRRDLLERRRCRSGRHRLCLRHADEHDLAAQGRRVRSLDWVAGALYRVGAKGKPERLLKLNKGSADFVYLAAEKTVLVPIMLSNTLAAYKLD